MPTLADIALGYAADSSKWPVRPCFDAERRWYHRIFSAADHEAWLLTWLPGQGTDLHDHGGSAGAFVVLQGELTEATVAPRPEPGFAVRPEAAFTVGPEAAFAVRPEAGFAVRPEAGFAVRPEAGFAGLRGRSEPGDAGVAGRHGVSARARGVGLVERRLKAGRVRPFGAAHVHRVRNAGTVPAISLHVYSPALVEMRRYEVVDGALRLAQLELAGRDW